MSMQAGPAGREIADRGPAAGVRPWPGGDRDGWQQLPGPDHPHRPAELSAPSRATPDPLTAPQVGAIQETTCPPPLRPTVRWPWPPWPSTAASRRTRAPAQ
ncbi:hypothetical protein G6F32_016119 [Rhizopus arrhizus]|nr:hypothetical protein G6F32_016119 [Rhizopus arrhizus]